ncbi:MAG: hypothetical protein HOW73_00775 [Polyangiaceae bacterium]|nr:hypothetical protein [Polyangiaceae bacterium]
MSEPVPERGALAGDALEASLVSLTSTLATLAAAGADASTLRPLLTSIERVTAELEARRRERANVADLDAVRAKRSGR